MFGHQGAKRGKFPTQFLDEMEGLTRPGRGVYKSRTGQRPDSGARP